MKPIELTEYHKEKLLEMCKILFPEYNNFEITSSFPYYNSNELEGIKWLENPTKDAICLIKDDKDDYRSVTIHWFEFCFIHLIPKFKKYGINIDYWLMTLPSTHCQWPIEFNHSIDYLYEQFKKLNK
jgi:hypothetical protein